ncbi:MAG: hypothetical protein ACKVIB_05120 [Pseudomonadales bacterium]
MALLANVTIGKSQRSALLVATVCRAENDAATNVFSGGLFGGVYVDAGTEMSR